MIARHPRDDAMEHRVPSHTDAVRHEHILRASVGGIASEFAERSFGFMHVGQNFTLDDDFSAGWNLKIADAAARQPIRLAKQAADDFIPPHMLRVGIGHRAHVVQRMDAKGNGRREGLPALFRATVELIHAPPRMQRNAEAVLVLEHQPVKSGCVDAGYWIACGDLTSGDIWRRVQSELQRYRQTH